MLVVLLPVASAAALLVGQGGAIALGIGGGALAVAVLCGLAWVGITTIGALAAQGVPAGQAAAVVLAWRLVSHWLPIVAGLAVYAGVHRAPDPAQGA